MRGIHNSIKSLRNWLRVDRPKADVSYDAFERNPNRGRHPPPFLQSATRMKARRRFVYQPSVLLLWSFAKDSIVLGDLRHASNVLSRFAYPSNSVCPLPPIACREANPFTSSCRTGCLWLLTTRSLRRSRNPLSWYPGKYWHVVARGASPGLFQSRETGWAHEGLLGGARVWVSLGGRGKKHLLSCAGRTPPRSSGLPDRYYSAAWSY